MHYVVGPREVFLRVAVGFCTFGAGQAAFVVFRNSCPEACHAHETVVDSTTRSTTMIGLGCMRLSTVEPRDPVRAVSVINAALDAGATMLDTADAYCLD